MKRIIYILCISVLPLISLCADEVADSAYARRPMLVDQMPNAVVHQSDEVRALMEHLINGDSEKTVDIDGYRLQIYASNRQQQAKLEAEQMKQKLEKEIEEPVYVLSDQPFWKVRVGNFRTIAEASAYKEDFISRFPYLQTSTYVVRDKIQVKQ